MAVHDLDRMVDFYCDAFGFELASRSGWDDVPMIDKIVGLKQSKAETVMLRAGNAYVEMFRYDAPEGRTNEPLRRACDQGYTHFCLDVTDIEATYERLLDCGMTFNTPPPPLETLRGGKIRATYGHDPEGNIIEIQEILDDTYKFALARSGERSS